MGYSHYIEHTVPFDDKEWDCVTDAFSTLVRKAVDQGIGLSVDNETPLSAHQIVEKAWLLNNHPGEEKILINGARDGAHETFVIYKNGVPRHDRHRGDFSGFDSCKTAMKPYDTLITAALIWIESHFPGRLNPSSDGEITDWAEGMAFAHEAFPGDTLAYPPKLSEE